MLVINHDIDFVLYKTFISMTLYEVMFYGWVSFMFYLLKRRIVLFDLYQGSLIYHSKSTVSFNAHSCVLSFNIMSPKRNVSVKGEALV